MPERPRTTAWSRWGHTTCHLQSIIQNSSASHCEQLQELTAFSVTHSPNNCSAWPKPWQPPSPWKQIQGNLRSLRRGSISRVTLRYSAHAETSHIRCKHPGYTVSVMHDTPGERG